MGTQRDETREEGVGCGGKWWVPSAGSFQGPPLHTSRDCAGRVKQSQCGVCMRAL